MFSNSEKMSPIIVPLNEHMVQCTVIDRIFNIPISVFAKLTGSAKIVDTAELKEDPKLFDLLIRHLQFGEKIPYSKREVLKRWNLSSEPKNLLFENMDQCRDNPIIISPFLQTYLLQLNAPFITSHGYKICCIIGSNSSNTCVSKYFNKVINITMDVSIGRNRQISLPTTTITMHEEAAFVPFWGDIMQAIQEAETSRREFYSCCNCKK
jgi:hypothetical protein